MQKAIVLLFLGWLGTHFSACSQNNAPATATIDAAKTESLIQSEPGIQILDVRTPREWQQTGVIPGAKKIDINSPEFQAQLNAQLDKNKPVIVYCAAGGRSPRAAAMMAKMGFKKVYDYAGGMNDWKAKGKKTVQ